MTEAHDESSRSLAGLSALLLSPSDTETTLGRVAELAEGMVKGCDGASITIRRRGELVTAVSTAERARDIDGAQYEAGNGPCLDASDQLQAFNVASIADEGSWPAFREAAIQRGVRSSLSLPLTFGGQALGALNLYSGEPNAFDHCLEVCLMFVAQAAAAVARAQLHDASKSLVEEVGEPLRADDVIAQARHILVERNGCTPEEALDLLRQRSELLSAG